MQRPLGLKCFSHSALHSTVLYLSNLLSPLIPSMNLLVEHYVIEKQMT
jgi:hypothetical protein